MASRSKHNSTAETIELLYKMHAEEHTWAQIAEAIGITVPTMRRHYKHEMAQCNDKGGRPKFKKTDDNTHKVFNLLVMGWTHEAISKAIGCNKDTFLKYFQHEIDTAKADVESELADILRKFSKQGSSAHAKMLLNEVLGKAENIKNEMSGPGGTPLDTTFEIVFVDPADKK